MSAKKSTPVIVAVGGIDRLEFAITNSGDVVLLLENGTNRVRMTMSSTAARYLASALEAVADTSETLI